MRSLVLTLLLVGALLPATAQASACTIDGGVYDCDVRAGPVSAGAYVDTRWWPIEAEFYHCVDVYPPDVVDIRCQWYRLA